MEITAVTEEFAAVVFVFDVEWVASKKMEYLGEGIG